MLTGPHGDDPHLPITGILPPWTPFCLPLPTSSPYRRSPCGHRSLYVTTRPHFGGQDLEFPGQTALPGVVSSSGLLRVDGAAGVCGPRGVSTELGSELSGPLEGVHMGEAEGLRTDAQANIPSVFIVHAKNSGEPKAVNPDQAFQGAAGRTCQ